MHKKEPPCRLSFKMWLSLVETSGPVCLFNNGWWSLGAQWVFLCHKSFLQRHQKWAEWFPAAVRLIWTLPPADMLFPWLGFKSVWLIIAACCPGRLQTSGVMCICYSSVSCGLLLNKVHQKTTPCFLLFNLCSSLLFACNAAEGHATHSQFIAVRWKTSHL